MIQATRKFLTFKQGVLLAALGMMGVFLAARAIAGGGGGFPPAGVDAFQSKGVFKIVLSPSFGGTTHVIKLNDPGTVIRSDPLTSGVPCSGQLGDPGAPCPGGCSCTPDFDGTCDSEIGPPATGFDQSPGIEEAHIELKCMTAEQGGWTLRFGEAAPGAPRSLGEVESRPEPPPPDGGFPADSFFNLYMEIDPPPGLPFSGQVLRNLEHLQTVDLDGYSFGQDGGNVMLLSVSPSAMGSPPPPTAINFQNNERSIIDVGTIQATCGLGGCEPFEDFDSCPLDCSGVPVTSDWSGMVIVLSIVVASIAVLRRGAA
jgi:hypothetical protein